MSDLEKQAKTLTLRVKKITNEEYFDLLQEKHSLKVQLEQARKLCKSMMDDCSFTDVKLHKYLRKLLGVLEEKREKEA